MQDPQSIEELVADTARAFAKRHRDALVGVETRGMLPAHVLEGCNELGWLGELEDEDDDENEFANQSVIGVDGTRHTPKRQGSKLLATVVHELSRVSPALGTRLLCHHFARRWCDLLDDRRNADERRLENTSWLSMAPFASDFLVESHAFTNGQRGRTNDGIVPMALVAPVTATLVAPMQVSPARVALVRIALEAAARRTPVETLGLTGLGIADIGGFRSPITSNDVVSDEPDAISRGARGALRYVFPAYLALARAILRTAYEGARCHAELRRQGGGRLDELPTIRVRLAILIEGQATLEALAARQDFSDDELDALLPRVRLLLLKGTDASLQIFGGAGYVVGTGQERLWRDARQVSCLFGSRLGKLG
ncbi:MAG: acyl-CoA dehydrogenase family protein [Polyangiaceae bacterium]